MIFSKGLTFSNNQAVTATAVSTHVVDMRPLGTPFGHLGPLKRDMGKGNPIEIFVGVTEGFNNLTSLAISIEVDDNEAFASATTLFTSPAYLLADLSAGGRVLLPTEFPVGNAERYVRLRYTVVGAAPTLGKVYAGVVMGQQHDG